MSTSVSKSLHSRLAQTLDAVPRSGIRDFFDIVSTMKDVISLGIGEPDFDTPWHIREAAVFALEKGATSYTSNLGLLSLRQGISEYVRKQFHMDYNPDNEILITVGVSEALDLASYVDLRTIVDAARLRFTKQQARHPATFAALGITKRKQV